MVGKRKASNLDRNSNAFAPLKDSREQGRRRQVKQAFNESTLFPFLKLPRELRDLIYGYLFSFDGVQRCINRYNAVFPSATSVLRNPHLIAEFKCSPSILLVNRQLYAEALPLLASNELYITNPLLASDFGGLGLSFAKTLMPDALLARVKYARFRFQIWDISYFNLLSRGLVNLRDAGLPSESLGCWYDEGGNTALIQRPPWVVLWVHFLQVWETSPMPGRKLVLEQEYRTTRITDDEPRCYVMNFRYDVPTSIEELARIKKAVFECWKTDASLPLLDYLSPFATPSEAE